MKHRHYMQGMETTGSMVLYIFPRMQENKCPLSFTAMGLEVRITAAWLMRIYSQEMGM